MEEVTEDEEEGKKDVKGNGDGKASGYLGVDCGQVVRSRFI